MTYVINVSYNGKHIFATREYSYYEAKKIYQYISKIFATMQYCNIDVIEWNRTGTEYASKEDVCKLFNLAD